MSESKIDLIAKLLAKAESTTPEEAEALTEHAERLMSKYLIDQAVIDARRAREGKTHEKIVEKRRDYKGNFAGEMFNIGRHVAWGMGTVKTMQSTSKGFFHLYLVGFESDVAQAELLIDSLEVQAMVAVRAWWKENKADYSHLSGYNQEKARRSFVNGFGEGAGTRIFRNRKVIIEEASTGTELVLVDRTKQVDDYVADRTAGGKRGRSRNAATGGAASADGFVAGQNANTGEKGLSQGRGIEA